MPTIASGQPLPPWIAIIKGALPIDIQRANNAARVGMVAFHEGQYEKAVEFFEQFVEEAPDNPYGHMYLGLSQYSLGEPNAAIDAMERAFDLAISGEAFHWISPEIGYPKVASALKDGGSAAFFWILYLF